ncbi:MAG: ABC transporter ATP-binding protein [Elusimicrobiota bacterium]
MQNKDKKGMKMNVRNLRIEKKSFSGSREILRDFNAEFFCGVNVVYGPPGCGKTSLLNTLAGLDKPSGGEIEWDGKISMVSQVPEREFIYADCLSELNKGKGSCAGPDIKHKLTKVGLSSSILPLSPWSLSRGEKKRLTLLRALGEYTGEKKVLIMDDPFCDLDSKGRDIISLILKEFEKQIIIISTNCMEDLKLCDDKEIKYRLIDLNRASGLNA